MKTKNIGFFFGLCVIFCSCEKSLMSDDIPATPTNIFNYLWQKFDTQYSMFDVKGVDWDRVYDSLYPMVYDGMSSDSLFAVCAAMLNVLNDGHVNLYSSYDISRCDSLLYRFYSESDFDVNTVVLNYLGINYHSTGGMANASLCGGKVIYIYYGSFSSGISVGQIRHIIQSYPEAEGMILDIRGNGGGSIANVDNILSVMPSVGQKLYSSQIKNGPAHDAFATLQETYAPVVPDSLQYKKPVYVLIDRGCYSAASIFAISTMAYDNMILMGDTTSGGLGLPTMGFLPNGWRYRFPVTRAYALDGKNYENGVPPQIYLRLDRQGVILQGRDNIIDSACALIMQHAE